MIKRKEDGAIKEAVTMTISIKIEDSRLLYV